MRVGRLDPGAIELRRGQRQLIALARGAEFPRALHVQPIALAPGAGERVIDIDVDAEIRALRADLIGGNHVIHQRLDKGRLVEIEKGVSGRCRRCGRYSLLGLRDVRRDDRGRTTCRRRAADNGGLEKVAPVESRAFKSCGFWPRLRCSRLSWLPPCRRERTPGHIFVKHAAFGASEQDAITQGRTKLRLMAPDGFMTVLSRSISPNSHHRDQIFRGVHMLVGMGDSCRLPDFCGALATGICARRGAQSGQGVLIRRLRNLVRGSCVYRAFFGELR